MGLRSGMPKRRKTERPIDVEKLLRNTTPEDLAMKMQQMAEGSEEDPATKAERAAHDRHLRDLFSGT